MSRGRAVLRTRAGGPAELVDNGRTGLLVAPGDTHALADALVRTLTDRELAARLGGAARAGADSRRVDRRVGSAARAFVERMAPQLRTWTQVARNRCSRTVSTGRSARLRPRAALAGPRAARADVPQSQRRARKPRKRSAGRVRETDGAAPRAQVPRRRSRRGARALPPRRAADAGCDADHVRRRLPRRAGARSSRAAASRLPGGALRPARVRRRRTAASARPTSRRARDLRTARSTGTTSGCSTPPGSGSSVTASATVRCRSSRPARRQRRSRSS